MGVGLLKKLKIGYWPLSQTLNSAGDRRRLIFWAKTRGHTVTTDLSQKVDVVVASENSDFNSTYFSNKRVPLIFDLVDAYLSPLNPFDDFARGFAKRTSGQISGPIKPFSHHVGDFCLASNAVICSSIEQEAVIGSFNTNTHVILDSHDEIPFIDALETKSSKLATKRILWEGQPATIRGVRKISPVLFELSKTIDLNFYFVTDERYFQFLNRYIERSTLRILKRDLNKITDFVSVIPWTSSNLVECSRGSSAAVIPIDLAVPMQRLKPENRLLIMWRLGLPCLTSSSPAYVRVADQAGVTAACSTQQEWLENLSHLLCDPGYALSQVMAGQEYLREYHNRSILLKKWDMAFQSVMG